MTTPSGILPDQELNASLQTPDLVRQVTAKEHGSSSTLAEGNLDLEEFFSLLYNMLKIDTPNTILAPAYPKYLRPGTEEYSRTINTPTVQFPTTITYRVIRREPGTHGGNKEPFGTGFKELTPHERRWVPQVTGSQLVIWGQNFDNEIQFEVWCTTNFEAEKTVNWFERYLRSHRVWLRDKGLGEILFMRRTEDHSELDNKLERRSLVFYVRTEELTTTDEVVLRNLEIQLGIRTT